MTIHVVGRLAAAGIRTYEADGRLIAESFDGSIIGPESIELLIAYKPELLERIRWLRDYRPGRITGGEVRPWGFN